MSRRMIQRSENVEVTYTQILLIVTPSKQKGLSGERVSQVGHFVTGRESPETREKPS